jgi:hypothetical protein
VPPELTPGLGGDGIWIENGGALRVQKMRMDDFSGANSGFIDLQPTLNPQITLSNGATPSTVNEVTLNNNEINLTDNSITTTTLFSTTQLSQTTASGVTGATWANIINTTNTPSIPTLQQVLTAGNNAQDPLTLGIQNGTLSTATILRGDQIELEIDDGINPAQLVGLSYNGIGHNSGGNNLPYTIQTDGDLTLISNNGGDILLQSANLNMSATALTIPATGQPVTAQITQDGLTMIDTTNSWNSWYRKSSAFVSNLAGTIYTYITNTGVQITNLTTTTSLTATGVTSGASSATWATIIAGGGSGTLQSVLTAGNTATGASALIGLTNSGVGYTSNPQLTLNNSNATAGATTGIPSVETYKSGRNAIANDIIATNNFYANNYAGTKTEFAKIEASVRNTAVGNDDGAIAFFGLLNGVQNQFFTLNGQDGENNCFLPLDMNGQAVKTNTGNLTISATASSGNGDITIAPKRTVALTAGTAGNITGTTTNGNISMTANGLSGGTEGIISITADRSVSIASAQGGSDGSIILDTNSIGDIYFVGTNLQTATAGGNSGQHLRIRLNGTYYKIQLLDD